MGELTAAAASMTAFAVEEEVTFTAGMAKPIFFAAAKSSITWPTRAKQCRFENMQVVQSADSEVCIGCRTARFDIFKYTLYKTSYCCRHIVSKDFCPPLLASWEIRERLIQCYAHRAVYRIERVVPSTPFRGKHEVLLIQADSRTT